MELSRVFLRFILYSFSGWLIEVLVFASIKRSFVKRGFLSGPLCPVYGFGALAVTAFLRPLAAYPLAVFPLACLIAAAVEYATGWFLESAFSLKWWDYSKRFLNLKGRVCLLYSSIFGALGTFVFYSVDPAAIEALKRVPLRACDVAALGGMVCLALDLSYSLRGFSELPASAAARALSRGGARLARIFPGIQAAPRRRRPDRPERPRSFAAGFNYYKLFWVFIVSGNLGVVLEMLWCLVAVGRLESRTGLVYGMQNPVYGFGALLMTLALSRHEKRRDVWIFLGSLLIGGAFEYLCSLGQETVFGSVSWEYSKTALNLQGRTNLMFSLIWGILGLLWVRYAYPPLSRAIERIPNALGKALTWVLSAALAADIAVSAAAVMRWSQRLEGRPPANAIERAVDERFPDARLERIYPHMTFRKASGGPGAPRSAAPPAVLECGHARR